MKKLLSIFLVLAMAFAMTACGKEKAEESEEAGVSTVSNPIQKCESADELNQTVGIVLDAPKGAKDVQYQYIVDKEGKPEIGEVIFTLDGKQYDYRAKFVGDTSLVDSKVESDENASAEELSGALDGVITKWQEMAGIYSKFKASASVDMKNMSAVAAFNEGKDGFIVWLDVAPGIAYTLSMDNDCTQDLLMKTAEKCYVPSQGDVG